MEKQETFSIDDLINECNKLEQENEQLKADLTSYEFTHEVYSKALEIACKDNIGINYDKVQQLLEQARKEICND